MLDVWTCFSGSGLRFNPEYEDNVRSFATKLQEQDLSPNTWANLDLKLSKFMFSLISWMIHQLFGNNKAVLLSLTIKRILLIKIKFK